MFFRLSEPVLIQKLMKIGVNNTITATRRISIYHDHTVQLIYFKKDLPDDFQEGKLK